MARNLIVSGRVDRSRVRAWLDARPGAFEDPHAPGSGAYMLFGTAAEATRAWEERLRDGTRWPRGVQLEVADEIAIQQEYGDAEALFEARALARWLVATVPGARVRIDGFGDVTDEGVDAQYPAGLRAPAPALIEIGFFRELAHGDPDGPALADATARGTASDDADLAVYLAAGQPYRGADRVADDVVSGVAITRPHVLTDGVYVWPADLAHYVGQRHARLPRHARLHARARDYRVTALDAAALAALPGSVHAPAPTMAALERLARVVVPEVRDGEAWTLTVDDGAATIGRRLRAGSGDEVRTGWLTYSGTPVLITLTAAHDTLDADRAELALAGIDGIAPLEAMRPVGDAGIPYEDVLVERLPPGGPALGRAPLPAAAVIELGIAIARVLAEVHGEDRLVGGVTPETVYVDERGFTGLVPRGPRFIARAPQRLTGPRSYRLPYDAPEVLGLGQPASEANDVFALCATLAHVATGQHPFGGHVVEVLQGITRGGAPRLPAGPLGEVLARGLAREARPTATELVELLEAVR